MTSDSKVGLLLGLVFIFIIAFVINGLPNLRKQKDTNELTLNMARPRRTDPGIGTSARKATRPAATRIEPEPESVTAYQQDVQPQTRPVSENQVRFRAELPKPAGASTITKEAIAVLKQRPASKAAVLTKTRSKLANLTRIYMVEEGDSLAYIAKKFYGEEKGNVRANVKRIFQANRKVLKSPDSIYVGQKLIVPALKQAVAAPTKVLVGEKFESVGRRHLKKVKPAKKRPGKYYQVKPGDSLYKIAANQLGNGNRYPEIARLNADVLENEDLVAVGMRLKLPRR